MKQYFITGTSSGIGKAIAEQALSDGDKVTGISRRHIINHPNYTHLNIDLSDIDSYLKINFDNNKKASSIILINNAGWLGEVKPVADLKPEKIRRAYHINLIAPSVLCKMFLDQTRHNDQKKVIINISSGAGSHPINSWSTYCAAKAGLNLFTQVLKKDHPNIHCFAISPGVVDTEMQGEIRRLNAIDFPDHQKFLDYKNNGELFSTKWVANKILGFVREPSKAPGIIFSLRDVS